MLAAETAWRVLRAEHARMRELLASIDAALQSDQWMRPGRALSSLRQLVKDLRTFDDSTHRPKGVVLLATLRGRSSEADDLLDKLDLSGRQCEHLLSQALVLLDAVEQGDEGAAAQCASVLEQHRSLMHVHLDEEDTVLHSHTAELLTPEEWSRIVSSISSVVEAVADHRRR
jgi:hemerythrin-like domain-containing protein